MGLRSGFDEHYQIEKEADYIHRCRTNATTSTEYEKWVEQGKELARQIRTEYGHSDRLSNSIIEAHYLDRD